ncbi:MAG: hypothetical protein UY06_C0007G0018 [Candidatus Amesbacteria bacterium GW2011_GWA2_47_70]|uniref:DNA alkylation repair protein n=1 Tax=Candidatus Amesbacteria bacterium GW2011_GWC2_45_19 TaxID=1618366 RepID=A0A0G1M4W2_9BACT|nr:MAG: hypothetical protein UX05_C0002G0057 [Candidatus Amesbacteria bacterium GW2011_GWC2_45_19]KKU80043.1 MAG: hypothetical protein UY06_C0007G0018 [Candidatus Amesbacteria bacterium GW2011_GWA2_47_70]
MNKFYLEILEAIKQKAKKTKQTSETSGYLGHRHFHYGLSVPQRRVIANAWIKNNNAISLTKFITLLDLLYRGDSYEEKSMAGLLLGYLPKLRRQLNPKLLDNWLSYLEGWAEIDSTCQSNFTADEILLKWNDWEKLIKSFADNKSVSKRRASLVLLTGVVNNSNDKRLIGLAFEVIDKLKSERDILITKAVSWLLRNLIRHNKIRVEKYLDENLDYLPIIAIRETKNKLRTGKK